MVVKGMQRVAPISRREKSKRLGGTIGNKKRISHQGSRRPGNAANYSRLLDASLV